jgi:hypothetical protein
MMASPMILRWKITLADSRPPIWRRFQVSDQITLVDFHAIVQGVMGWEDAHLHTFEVGGDRYAPAEFELEYTLDSHAKTLAALNLSVGAKVTYTYDFGDGWLHVLKLEELLPLTPETPHPHCLKGKRACPPEDCGGVWGYEGLLERLEDYGDPNYEEMLNQIGLDFDPEKFDLAAVNQTLKQVMES